MTRAEQIGNAARALAETKIDDRGYHQCLYDFEMGAEWADTHPLQSGPTRYRAKKIGDGQWVEGWYVLHHFPLADSHNNVIGYEEVPMLFNDAPGVRDKGTYWHAIDPSTLEVIKEQLSLFEEL